MWCCYLRDIQFDVASDLFVIRVVVHDWCERSGSVHLSPYRLLNFTPLPTVYLKFPVCIDL